jgi:hypothetical protein
MQEMSDATGPIGCEGSGAAVTSTEVLIVGFGFSVIPLIRELERDGIDYVVVSSGDSIWDKLEKHARLDFDMVSSMHTSLYSFELVKRDSKDRYLPVKEFQAFIKQYLAEYDSKVINDWVTLVENHASGSIVHTRGGRVFSAKHLVCATAFKRRMNQTLNEFDYASATNKTIAITAMGDSVNLMVSKLIPNNNRIVLVTNGFMLLDKLSFYDDTSYTLDQLEYHNMRRVSYLLYRKMISGGLECVLLCQKLFRFLRIDQVYFKYPLAIRNFRFNLKLMSLSRSPVPNGIIAIKYWPIDSYQKLFDNEALTRSISEGYLLNDIAFFLDQGLVELWPKHETILDREGSTIRWRDNVIKFDHIVNADHEVPNLPDIVVVRPGAPRRKYEYAYRGAFMGVIPKELSNVYFIGFTRPTTGGLNNIIEMQCLLTHKLIVDSDFHREIHENVEQRIQKYDRYYYLLESDGRTDHLVHYGFYTDDVAKLMGISSRLSECRSIRDLVIHFIFPNTAFKFRQRGSYGVPGVKEMVDKIYDDHKGFSVIMNYLLTYALLQLTAYVALIVAYLRGQLSMVSLAVLLLIVLVNPVTAFVAANGFGRNSVLNVVMVAALGLTAWYQDPVIPVTSLLVVFALTYVFRRLGWTRAPFNDLKNKKSRKYKAFFERYCDAFRRVGRPVGG